MLRPVNTRVPSQVEEQIRAIHVGLFPRSGADIVGRAFSWVRQCFEGHYAEYQAIDAKYHDFEHTLQGALCMVQLLEGRHRAKALPVLTPRMFELGLFAVLFHDTGYLKLNADTSGTGAKYTLTHVERGAEFAAKFLAQKGYPTQEIETVQEMIRCTGLGPDPRPRKFQSDLDRVVGYALGTADLLGQMAAPDYIEKLPILFLEFAEANRFSKDTDSHLNGYQSAQELIAKTPAFWERCVWPRINIHFQGLYKFLNDPYPNGPNPYLDRIRANLARLQDTARCEG